MKQLIFFLVLIYSSCTVSGQQIVIGDKQWEGVNYSYFQDNFNSKFRSTTKEIDGIEYRELMFKVNGGWFEGVRQYYREADNKVYKLHEGEERVILDFTLNVGDTILISDDNNNKFKFFPIRTVDTLIYNRSLRKLEMNVIPEGSTFVSSEKHVWIEGVGDIGFFFGNEDVFNNVNASPLYCVMDPSTSGSIGFYSIGPGCPALTSITTASHLPSFYYDHQTKVISIDDDRIESVKILSITGVRLISVQTIEGINSIDLGQINQKICVVVMFDGKSYLSKIISI